jgi:hypothetical protein
MALYTTKLNNVTELVGIVVMLVVGIQEVLSLNLDWTSTILTEVFRGSSHSLQANARIVP